MATEQKAKVYLYNCEGSSRRSGTDLDGNQWLQFEVDTFAEQEPGECSICQATGLMEGWLCMDGGESACNDCVVDDWTTLRHEIEQRKKAIPYHASLLRLEWSSMVDYMPKANGRPARTATEEETDKARRETQHATGRLSYGSLYTSRTQSLAEADYLDGSHWFGSGDYVGGTVEKANRRVMLDENKSTVENYKAETGRDCPAIVARIDEMHGYDSLAFPLDVPMPSGHWASLLDETLKGLENYPVLDEDVHSQVEHEEEMEAWEDYGRNDFRKAIQKRPGDGSEHVEITGCGENDEKLATLWDLFAHDGQGKYVWSETGGVSIGGDKAGDEIPLQLVAMVGLQLDTSGLLDLALEALDAPATTVNEHRIRGLKRFLAIGSCIQTIVSIVQRERKIDERAAQDFVNARVSFGDLTNNPAQPIDKHTEQNVMLRSFDVSLNIGNTWDVVLSIDPFASMHGTIAETLTIFAKQGLKQEA